MSTASSYLPLRQELEERKSLRPLKFVVVFGLGVLFTLVAMPFLKPGYFKNVEVVDVALASEIIAPVGGDYAPHIPGTLLSQNRESSDIAKPAEFFFNFKLNSFRKFHYSAEGEYSDRLLEMFGSQVMPLGERDEFVASLISWSRELNLHPCLVASIISAPFSDEQASTGFLSFLADTPAEAFSRAGVVGVESSSYDDLLKPTVAAEIAVKYTALLNEVYPAMGNVITIAYWSNFQTMEVKLKKGQTFDFQDISLVHSAVKSYRGCVG